MRDIAIIGIGCRFPGADGPDAFWNLLASGGCAVAPFPADRWDLGAHPAPPAGCVENPAAFDAAFFGVTESEAAWIDPQQRLLLECAHWGLEHAGLTRQSLKGRPVGVFVGISGSEYGRRFDAHGVGPFCGTGTSAAVAANRLSYLFDWRGPSIAVDTACSSSLMAVLAACHALERGDCELALAGGVSLMMAPEAIRCLGAAGMLAADGRSKSFDAAADGYGRGEGAGLVVLRRLDDAVAAGERILAVIRGGAANQDGQSNGLTAPNPAAQEALLAAACADAGFAPADLDYVEAHGTGTLLGDPIEAKALGTVLGAGRPADRALIIGTVKTNIGHLEAAAGIAGLIKVVLALVHRRIPPSLHFTRPNPHIDFSRLGLRVAQALEDWPCGGAVPLAGISSFGFGGSNAHLVVSAAPVTVANPSPPPLAASWDCLVLSAKSEASRAHMATQWAEYLQHSEAAWTTLCASARNHRAAWPFRLAVAARDGAQAVARLRAGPVVEGRAPRRAPDLAVLFAGQGSQHGGAGESLYRDDPAFRDHLDECARLSDLPLTTLLFDAHAAGLAETRYAQPALFALGSGLYQWWRRHGVNPVAVGGHSLGDYMAAWAAGAMSLADGLRLVSARGRLMQALDPAGAMVVAMAGVDRVAALVGDGVDIAGINGPTATTLAGTDTAIDAATTTLATAGIAVRRLEVACAFHSRLLDPMLDALEREAAGIAWAPLHLPMACNLSGEVLPVGTVLTPSYWRRHSRQPVRFAQAVMALKASAFLEIGARPVLTPLVHALRPDVVRVSSLRPGRDDGEMLAEAWGHLFVAGVAVQGDPAPTARADLPLYPFDRKRFLMADRRDGVADSMVSPALPADPVTPVAMTPAATDGALARVRAMVAQLVGVAPDAVDIDQPFLEMGADSLVLVSAIGRIEKDFGVKLAVRQLFDQFPTVADLARHLDMVATPAAPAAADNPPVAGAGETVIETVVRRQLDLMQQQLDLLRGGAQAGAQVRPLAATATVLPAGQAGRAVLPPGGVAEKSLRALSPQQRRHLDSLVTSYTARTAKSKDFARRHRPVLADSRASAGFRFTTKEMLYPIVGARAEGARFWDVDDNAYVDITMGFGVHLFGHGPSFVTQALTQRLERGIPLGPQAEEAGEAAEIIARLTGMERVCFCNSGTEAVMSAIRLARAFTGRNRIAVFAGSYHGHYEGTLAEAGPDAAQPLGLPMVPGVSPGAVGDVLVLAYGDPRSLELIERFGPQLAAVIVEPVQSRRPDLQPVDFLRQLRQITAATGSLLVFDEMITGFRVHSGGAQAVFGVRADLATYGKVVGGGLPIGVVAGRADVLDAVDGGAWDYGDQSYPAAETTLFAGTFNKHPLTMAATLAVLRQIEASGPDLYDGLNRRTEALCARLNRFFSEIAAPLSMVHFGSLFRFAFRDNLDLLFYHLLSRGVYVWEGRNCFLSAAHGDSEVDFVATAIEDSVLALADGGFLPTARPPRRAISVPLSTAQRQLAVLARLSAPASAAYGVSLVLDVATHLAPDRLQRALGLLLQRHEALAIAIGSDALDQRVDPAAELRLECETGDREAATAAFLARPFDLAMAPLLRVLLIPGSDGDRLVLAGHHVVLDGLSLQILARDLSALYADEGAALPPAPSWRRFLAAAEARKQGPEGDQARAYWSERFASLPPPLDLPGDRPRPPARSWGGGRVAHVLAPGLGAKVAAAAGRQQATGFMLLLAAFAALLHRLTGADDLVIGVPYAGRDADGGDGVVGYCTHLLPVRLAPQAGDALSALVAQCRTHLLDAFEHAAVPLADLLDLLRVPRSPARSPLIDVVFNVDKVDGALDFAGAGATLVAAPAHYAKFDLGVNVTESAAGWRVEADYNADLFDQATARHLLALFERVLAQACDEPGRSLAALTLADPDEIVRLSVDFNANNRDFPNSGGFHHRVLTMAAIQPRALAVTGWVMADGKWQRQDMDYGELAQRALVLAADLAAAGVTKGERVALVLPRGPQMVVALLGVLAAGAAYVPLEPELPPARRAQLFAAAGCRVAVADGPLDLPVVRLDRPGSRVAVPVTAAADAPAYVLFTSGSTGTPKPVIVPHGAMTNYADAISERLRLEPGWRYAMVSTFMADLGNTCLLPSLVLGGHLLVPPVEAARDPAVLATCLDDLRPHVVKIVPTHLAALLSVPAGQALLPERLLVLGGERCPAALAARLAELRPTMALWNHYGPTEACVGVLAAPIDADDPGALGRPLANCQVYVLDPELRPLPAGMAGDLWIGGAGLALGYLGQPERTAQAFRQTPFGRLYHSGDRARFRLDGRLELLGRMDDQIKIRGFRVEPGEVAAVLGQWPAVAQAEVIGRDDNGTTRLVAYVVAAGTGPVDATAARAFLAERLPEHMVPAAVVVLDALPMTANGKVDRAALPAPMVSAVTGDAPREPAEAEPGDSAQAALLACWRQVLGRDDVGVDDDFFALGGDSIQSIQVAAVLHRQGLGLNAGDVYRFPTVRRLAPRLVLRAALTAEQGRLEGDLPLLPIQHRFFEDRRAAPHHWNMSVLLDLQPGMTAPILQAALDRLLDHHDALAQTFTADATGWHAAYGRAARVPLVESDLSALGDGWVGVVADLHDQVQASFDLSRGPLFAAHLVRRPADLPPQLLLVAHHLVMDGVSWRILLDDLAALLAGDSQALGAKTASVRQWARRLQDLAASDALTADARYWHLSAQLPPCPLPVRQDRLDPTEGEIDLVTLAMDSGATTALLSRLAATQDFAMDDVLLAALLSALAAWSGEEAFLIELEGHGREPLEPPLDLSRTVGWFSTRFPVWLGLDDGADLALTVAEQRHAVPRNGLGYGLLRYLRADPILAAAPRPEISFNYLGRFDPGLGAKAFRLSRDGRGRERAAGDPRRHLLAVDAMVIGNRLEWEWSFDPRRLDLATVQALATATRDHVTAWLARHPIPERAVTVGAGERAGK